MTHILVCCKNAQIISLKVLVALPYRSRSFYLITFYGGDHVEFTVKDFPEMIHEVIF